ncbi:hypothetical protein Hanom_Chr01g00021851 [Helianthus anomalus]
MDVESTKPDVDLEASVVVDCGHDKLPEYLEGGAHKLTLHLKILENHLIARLTNGFGCGYLLRLSNKLMILLKLQNHHQLASLEPSLKVLLTNLKVQQRLCK